MDCLINFLVRRQGLNRVSKDRWNIPDSWLWIFFGEIANVIGGGTPNTRDLDNFTEKGIPWLTPADLSNYNSAYIERGARDLSEKGLKNSSAKILPKGTVLFTSRAPIGYCAIAANKIATNQGFKSFVLYEKISSEFIRFYLLFSKEYAESLASGSTFKELSGQKAAQLKLPLPPLNEQKRIVTKIEALQKRSQRVKTELDAIKPLLDQFRQSVLAAAFRCDLTADWRENNPDVEPAEMLLHHSPQATNGLSDTWYLTTVGDIVKSLKYGTSKKCNYDVNGIPVLRIPNIVNGTIDALDLKYADLTKEEFEKVSLLPGDILMIRSNGSVSLVGRTAIVTEAEKNFAYAGYLIRIRPNHQLVNPEYLNLWFSSYEIRLQIEIPLRSTSGVNNINSDEAKRLPIPLPPLAEQLEIVRRIESLFKLTIPTLLN
jgi:type I restriction enzyme, S subunit